MSNDPNPSIYFKSAIEALRNGVPNKNAVSVLGCTQPEAEERFLSQLEATHASFGNDSTVPGLLVQGDFGSGKSHLLEYFEHLALERNFVCSKIVISRETPLYDPEKMFRAAIENGVVPDRTGQMIDEIAVKLDPNSRDYAEMVMWANHDRNGISKLFPATLMLHQRLSNDPELVHDIERFWSGDPMLIPKVRRGLRDIGQSHAYNIRRVPARTLAIERLKFALKLIRGAGYSGWVVLIDELELISRYTIVQRGRSYAELARWMGKVIDESYPGLASVGTITADFTAKRLYEGQDRDYVVPRLRSRGTDEFNLIAARAESGMRLIENEFIRLASPDASSLEETYSRLKRLHSKAYDWSAPDVPDQDRRTSRSMRSHVRWWITQWDLKRLYPNASVQIEEQEVSYNYTEDKDLERETPDDSPTGISEPQETRYAE
jgi:hypothetical protein